VSAFGASPSGGRAPNGGSVLWTLFAYEMRMLLRDRRTLLIAVVAPLILFPVMIFSMRSMERAEERRLEQATYTYAVEGTLAEEARGWVAEALELHAARQEALAQAEGASAGYRFVERTPGAVSAALERGDLELVVLAMTPDEFEAERAAAAAVSGGAAEADATAPTTGGAPPGVPVLRLLYRADSNLSRAASERMAAALRDLRTDRRGRVYADRGLWFSPEAVLQVAPQNVASAEREGRALLGLALTPFLLLLMLSGGSIVAADAIAGEKERGTLETLLTTAARRSQIVDAKMLSIVVVGLAVAAVNVLNMLAYLVIGVIELPADLSFGVSPLALGLAFLMFVPLTLLVSSVLLLLSGYARSYKEYQIYFFPVFWLFLLPSLAGMLPGMRLRSAVAVVPIANVGVAVREIMVEAYDWPFLFLAFASTAAAAVGLARLTGRTLSTERLISRNDLDEADLVGGPALFPRHVLRWFGVMGVLLLVISLWTGEGLGIRGQALVNMVGLFLGGTLLMVWKYRLPARDALALRPVRPLVWLAVIVGAPSALLVGSGVAQAAQYVLPVPQRMIEAFGQFLLPEAIPLWQLLFFLAVLPAVCEELAFRGVLLHGLGRYLRPVPLALVTGLIFGLFHVSLFRIFPTAYLGVVLAAVTLLTGSIFPAMLWHALNNAAALVPAHMGWLPEGLAVDPWMHAAGGVGLALAFGVLWWQRTPLVLQRPVRAGAEKVLVRGPAMVARA